MAMLFLEKDKQKKQINMASRCKPMEMKVWLTSSDFEYEIQDIGKYSVGTANGSLGEVVVFNGVYDGEQGVFADTIQTLREITDDLLRAIDGQTEEPYCLTDRLSRITVAASYGLFTFDSALLYLEDEGWQIKSDTSIPSGRVRNYALLADKLYAIVMEYYNKFAELRERS